MAGGAAPLAFTEALEHRYFLASVNVYGSLLHTTKRPIKAVYGRGGACPALGWCRATAAMRAIIRHMDTPDNYYAILERCT